MQETFAEYTARTSFERPLLSGVAYAQRVVDSERKEFERQHGWTIKTMKKERSPSRDEYAPVIFSQETVSYIESIDMMSGEVNQNYTISFLPLFGFIGNVILSYNSITKSKSGVLGIEPVMLPLYVGGPRKHTEG